MARCSSCAIITFPLPKNYMVSLLSYILSNIVSFCNQSCEIVQHMTNFISGYHSVSVHFSYARFCITNYGLKTEQLCVIINPIQEFPFLTASLFVQKGVLWRKNSQNQLCLDRTARRGRISHTNKEMSSVLSFLRGIYVAFSGVRANAPIWQKSQRYFDAAVWVTHLRREPTWFSVWMGNKIFRLYGGEKAGLRPEVPANDQSA